MPKRRRLLMKTHMKKKANTEQNDESNMISAQGRFKGALLDQLEVTDEESESSPEKEAVSRDSFSSNDNEPEDIAPKTPKVLDPLRQSYVLKLFDRSVDLSQFQEDSPLYPICRAWIANQPKADYSIFGKADEEEAEDPSTALERIELPRPKGPLVTRIPDLLPEQIAGSKDNINLDYSDSPLPTQSELISFHMKRWTRVRQTWQRQAVKVEARYSESQNILNRISVNASP